MLNQPEEYFIEVVSNASTDIFPENNLSKFSNRLHHPLLLEGDWSVGLQEIFYPSTIIASDWSVNIDVTYTDKTIPVIATIKASDKIEDVVAAINHALKRVYIKISSSMTSDSTVVNLDELINDLLNKTEEEILQIEPRAIKSVYGKLVSKLSTLITQIDSEIKEINNAKETVYKPHLKEIERLKSEIASKTRSLLPIKNKISHLLTSGENTKSYLDILQKRMDEHKQTIDEKQKEKDKKVEQRQELEAKVRTSDEDITLANLIKEIKNLGIDIDYDKREIGLLPKVPDSKPMIERYNEFKEIYETNKKEVDVERKTLFEMREEIKPLKEKLNESKELYKSTPAPGESTIQEKEVKQKKLNSLLDTIRRVFQVHNEDSEPPQLKYENGRMILKRGIYKFNFITPKFNDPSMYPLLGFGDESSTMLQIITNGQVTSIEEPNLNLRAYLLFIYSDIVAEHFVGNGNARVLRVLPIKKGAQNELIHEIFTKPHYYPLRANKIEDINVILADETGNNVKFASGRVLLGLHLRKD